MKTIGKKMQLMYDYGSVGVVLRLVSFPAVMRLCKYVFVIFSIDKII